MRCFCWLSLVLSLLAASPATVFAAAPDELYATGKEQFEAGRFAEAYTSFQQAFLQDPGNLDYSFHMGRAAFEKGDYEAATMAYDRILIAEPDSARVKLELARCHLQLGSRELAKQYFKEVLATNPPESVWQNIQQFLAAIEASERRHFLSGIFSVGVQYDDNARFASGDDVVFLNLADVLIPIPMAGKKRDWIYNSTAVVNHVYKVIDTPWSWKTSVTNYNAFYDTEDDLDINFLGLTTGPVRQTDKYLWEVQALGNFVELDYEQYLATYGMGSTLTLPFDERIFFILGATFQEKDYYNLDAKDAFNLRLHGGPVFTIDKNRLEITVSRETENADNDLNSYDRFSLGLRYDRLLPRDFACFAGIRFENTEYDQEDPFFRATRSDDLKEYKLGLSKTIWWSEDKRRNLAAQVVYTHTDAESSIAVLEYDKNVVATSVTLAF